MILRVLVITLAGLEALSCAVLSVVLYNSASDPLGRNIANGVAAVTAIPLVLRALPALVLGAVRPPVAIRA